jgi:hypothetical protein
MGHRGERERYLAWLNRPWWKKSIHYAIGWTILAALAWAFSYGVHLTFLRLQGLQ